MSRILLVHSPQAAPNQCVVCGTSDIGRGFVDVGFFAEFYGTPYFCETCVAEMASLFGMRYDEKTTQQIIELKAEVTRQHIQFTKLLNELKDFIEIQRIEMESGSSIGVRVHSQVS